MFNLIKRWYDRGLWTEAQVLQAVDRLITQEQADMILGAEE